MSRLRHPQMSRNWEDKAESILCTGSLILLAVFSGLLAVAWFLTPH